MSASYDVICIGGAAIGSAVAYYLTENSDFDGTVAVIEPDPSYDLAATSRAQNSIREQFSAPINIRICQYGLDFIDNFHDNVHVDGESPELNYRGTGYLFLARDDNDLQAFAEQLTVQHAEGAMTRMLTPAEVAAEFPYMDVSQIAGARMGSMREGSFDGWAFFQGYRQRAIHNGAEFIKDRVVDIDMADGRVSAVVLESGERIQAGHVVNAAGTRAKLIAAMVDLPLPVEPRARTSFVFDCRTPIEHNVPLTITPEGVHFRREQHHFMTGAVPERDDAVDYDDWDVRDNEFEEQIWPTVAKYVPVFDQIGKVTAWGGQYAYNTLDHNLIIGNSPDVSNFWFANGFSGHGLQQGPAVGRAVSELITYGEYRTLDLSVLSYERVLNNEPFFESVVI
jgi:glycine/D-amino acid oxidase-like deaminating enzyme